MPQMTIQIHPIVGKRLRGSHIDTATLNRGTGRTDAIILEGLLALQKQGYINDNSIVIADHFVGTQANLNYFFDRTCAIVQALGYDNLVTVSMSSRDFVVTLGWVK